MFHSPHATDLPSLRLQAYIDQLVSIQSPEIYAYVYRLMIVYGAVNFAVLISSLLILAIPLSRGREAREKHLWLWRRHSAPGMSHSIPYFVPNGGIAFVISQIFGSIVFEIYIWMAYQSLRSPKFDKPNHLFFWLAIANAPGFFGFWYMSFGAFYTFLFSPSQSAIGCHAKRHYIPHPVIMNTLCIGVPILTTLGGFGWGISATILTQAQREAFDSLISQLRTGHYSQAGMENYIAAAQHFILQFRWASFTWSIFALVAALSYCFTIFLFMRLLKETVEVARSTINLVEAETETNLRSESESKTRMSSPVALGSDAQDAPQAKRLRRGYHILIGQCALLMIVLVWYFVDGVILTVEVEKFRDSEAWRSFAVWIGPSSSFVLAGALILQAWRMLCDREPKSLDRHSSLLKMSEPSLDYEDILKLDLSPRLPSQLSPV